MAVNPQKLLPPTKSGSIVKYSASKVSSIVVTKKFSKDVVKAQTKIVKVQNILKGTLAIEKKSLDDKKRNESSERLSAQEEKLETKPNAEKGGMKMPKRPRLGIFDWIKNFISNVILGYFAVRLVKHLPKIMPVVKFLANATDFILNIGGKLLNGLATFVDWGYKAYDATRGFIKNIGGENFVQVFDKFVGAVDTTLFLASFIASDLAIEAITGGDGGGLGDIVGDQVKKRLFQRGTQQVATQAAGQVGRTAGLGVGAVAGIVSGAGLLASALGEGAFQLRKVATKPIQDAKKAYDNEKNPLMKIGRGAFLGGMNALLGPLSALGVLLDVVGAPFRYAIELLRFPFLSEEDKKKQANNLAKFDTRIREDFRKALNLVTLGFAFKERGSFGNIYGNKGAQNEMMSKMAGGGITRGGKRVTGARRTMGGDSGGKYNRQVLRKPSEVKIKPGADIGGKDKILGIFPNPLDALKRAVDVVNPFGVVKKTGEDLGKTDYFGPILAITSKITLGQKPSQKDYENVGLGINMLIAKGIKEKQLKGGVVAAFAEGGLVDPDVLSAVETGGDISNWVAKTFRGEIESNAQKTLRLIRENAAKKKSTGPDKSDPTLDVDKDIPGGMTKGQWGPLLDLIAGKESGGNYEAMYPSTVLKGATKMTIAEVAMRATGAVGKYQQLPQYLVGRAKSAGLNPDKDLYSPENQEKIIINVNIRGRGGQKWLENKISDEQFMQGLSQEFASLPNAQGSFYYPGQRSAMTPDKVKAALSKVKKGGYSPEEYDSNISLGKGHGEEGRKIAGELGRFLKNKGVVPGSIHRHPEHPPWSATSGHSKNSYHYQGRAIDLGGYTREQGPILAAIAEFNRIKGVKPVQLLHGGNEPTNHSDHVHVAYEKGGETLPYPHLAMVSERGKEIVIDNDSTVTKAAPMLLAINAAKDERGVLKAIRQYAPYDALSPQIVYVSPEQYYQDGDSSSSDSSGGMAFALSDGDEESFDPLYRGC